VSETLAHSSIPVDARSRAMSNRTATARAISTSPQADSAPDPDAGQRHEALDGLRGEHDGDS